MTTQVLVWLPQGGNVGHSSMRVGVKRGGVEMGVAEPDSYISFWPKKDRKSFIGSIILHWSANVVRRPHYHTYEMDLKQEGANPTVVEFHNLNESAIQDYWEKVQASERVYELADFNCSTVIANALYIGSGLQPSFRPLAAVDDYLGLGVSLGRVEAWEPRTILQYAQELQQELQQRTG